MPSSVAFRTIAKWKWVDRLNDAADNDQPISYLIGAFCVAMVILAGVSFARDCYRSWKGIPVPGGLLKASLASLIAIGFPMCFIYEIVPRLLK